MLRLLGEIDAETVAAYEQEHAPVVDLVAAVDLSEIRFLSSSAVAFLIRNTRPLRDGRQLPALCGVSVPARGVLEWTGALELFAHGS